MLGEPFFRWLELQPLWVWVVAIGVIPFAAGYAAPILLSRYHEE